jgi:hypothetical protein
VPIAAPALRFRLPTSAISRVNSAIFSTGKCRADRLGDAAEAAEEIVTGARRPSIASLALVTPAISSPMRGAKNYINAIVRISIDRYDLYAVRSWSRAVRSHQSAGISAP